MSREVEAILKVRSDLKDYTFMPCKHTRIVIPHIDYTSNSERTQYKNVEIYLGTKLKVTELIRFGVNNEIKTVAYKKVE